MGGNKSLELGTCYSEETYNENWEVDEKNFLMSSPPVTQRPLPSFRFASMLPSFATKSSGEVFLPTCQDKGGLNPSFPSSFARAEINDFRINVIPILNQI